MAFCTLLEWDRDFPLERYREMNQRADGHGEQLPDGCLARIVGPVDSGAAIVEVWLSGDDARRFSEATAHLLDEFKMPPPTRVAAFETSIFQSRGAA
jgi:hypothetical protein